MNTRTILKFNFDTHLFSRFCPDFAKLKDCNAILDLRHLSSKLKNFKGLQVSPTDRSEVYRKFIDTYPEGLTELKKQFKRGDVRSLANSLTYSEADEPYNQELLLSDDYLKAAINLISHYYSPSMIISLMDTHLNLWPQPNKDLSTFLFSRVHSYKGKRPIFYDLQKNSSFFFHKTGASSLAEMFIEKKLNPSNVWEYLGLPDHMRSSNYFSYFILHYTNSFLRGHFESGGLSEIIIYLKSRKDDITNKKVLVKIINHLGERAESNYRDRLKRFILDQLGDPQMERYRWQPWNGANERESRETELARSIFNIWFTEESIELFFDRLSRQIDPDDFKYRKDFWLSYAKHIDMFKIICTKNIKKILSRDEKTAPFVTNRTATFQSSFDDEECAFLFRIKSSVFVEFGRKGNALYVYDESNEMVPKFDKYNYNLKQLKHYTLKDHTINYLEREGRFIHKGSKQNNWQSKVSRWISRTHGVSASKSFINY